MFYGCLHSHVFTGAKTCQTSSRRKQHDAHRVFQAYSKKLVPISSLFFHAFYDLIFSLKRSIHISRFFLFSRILKGAPRSSIKTSFNDGKVACYQLGNVVYKAALQIFVLFP